MIRRKTSVMRLAAVLALLAFHPNLEAQYTITTVAGNGQYAASGDNGPAISAGLSPNGLAVDKLSNIYFADVSANSIRMVNTSGIITTIGCGGTDPLVTSLPALQALCGDISGLAADNAGNVFVAQGGGRTVDWLNSGIIKVLTGLVNGPQNLTVDNAGYVYVADTGNCRIAKLDRAGNLTNVAGSVGACGFTGDNHLATQAQLMFPRGVAVDGAGNIYIADTNNLRIRKVNTSGVITTVAGNGSSCTPTMDNIAAVNSGVCPSAVAVDAAGNLYIADFTPGLIRKVNTSGMITTIAGGGTNGLGDFGPATSAQLQFPTEVVVGPQGKIYVSDEGHNRVRLLTPVPIVRDTRGIGRSDAIIYDPSNGQEYTALSNGDGTYQYFGNLYTPGFDILRTGDFNGDGKADLVVYNSRTALAYIGLSNGDGTFAFQSLFWSPGFDIVETGDINGDGMTDFALYNSTTGTLYTGISNGDGTFTYQYHLVSIGFTFVRLADFNGDGKADLFLYNSNTGLAFLGIGDGTGAFAFHPLSISGGYDLADIGDLDGDGSADVILYNSANGNTATGISDRVGGFTFTPLIFSPGFTSVRLANYTGDGLAGVTLYNKTTAAAYFGIGTGTGTFTFQSLFWSPGYDNVEPQDVNGDGKSDVILYNRTFGTSYTGISEGTGAFTYTYALWGAGKTLAR